MLERTTYPFKLEPLPYEYNALEPIISERTMKLHHDKHLQSYIDKLNAILKDYPKYQNWSLEQLLFNLYSIPEGIRDNVRNNAGGAFNHLLYFDIINPKKQSKDTSTIKKAVINKYGSVEEFVKGFKEIANSVFGSGYVFLVINKKNELELIKTQNQNSAYELNLYPLMLIDLWEHAYYLDYQNRRNEYIENFMKIINFEKLEERYREYFKD